ncbi:hypothetical protein EVAR_93418_1 [Eumeta japonica]|uniref:Uncharacterized protein n=1 Tax=Eumeta variegata TaxID=151549 RepID=A0A4C1UPS7_EUMVA|nr:hypothetical protein EVAR_93418_1 [Eumeta japonica]
MEWKPLPVSEMKKVPSPSADTCDRFDVPPIHAVSRVYLELNKQNPQWQPTVRSLRKGAGCGLSPVHHLHIAVAEWSSALSSDRKIVPPPHPGRGRTDRRVFNFSQIKKASCLKSALSPGRSSTTIVNSPPPAQRQRSGFVTLCTTFSWYNADGELTLALATAAKTEDWMHSVSREYVI